MKWWVLAPFATDNVQSMKGETPLVIDSGSTAMRLSMKGCGPDRSAWLTQLSFVDIRRCRRNRSAPNTSKGAQMFICFFKSDHF
jgi:hypothetical protein